MHPTFSIFNMKLAISDMNNTYQFQDIQTYLQKLECVQDDRQIDKLNALMLFNFVERY